jgi:hypothetical protein
MAGKNIEKNYALPSSEGLTHPSTSLCRPQELFFRGKEKKKKKSGILFYEGLTHPSTSLYRPLGLFLEEKRKRKRSRGLHFPRG